MYCLLWVNAAGEWEMQEPNARYINSSHLPRVDNVGLEL